MIAVKMSNGPVIGELHVDAEIGVAQQLDDALQCVAVATADAHQVALDGGLHLQFAVLDLAHDLARLLDGNALLQRDLLLHRGAGRRNERPVGQPLQRHLALHQLAFQHLDHGFQLVLIRAGQEDLVVLLVQLDRGLGILQIVTLLNLLHGLLDGIADLRQLDLGDYVETVIGHRVYRALSAISTFSVISSMIPDDDLLTLPYVNGGLFEERLTVPTFSLRARNLLLLCFESDWSTVSPAIFGSMFQYVMISEGTERRHAIGGHYTSEQNILKLIKSLFMDDLNEEFQRVANDRSALTAFHDKLSRLRFFDPACGCGNFLVIAYRELRRLEMRVINRRGELNPQLMSDPT